MGLSAQELSAETLYPGDTIEYFSMAFVNGDPRGHRVAKVLKVLKDEPEYPLRLESQELLPVTLMIRRKLDRHDGEVDAADAKWRKIRTFKLVMGEVKGATRADRLNAGLRHSIASAIQAAKTQFASKKSRCDAAQIEQDGDNVRESGALEMRHKSPKRKKDKKKHRTLESAGESSGSRFQQQQLSFSRQEIATASSTKDDDRDAGREKPSASLAKTNREREASSCKRASLDTLSRKSEQGSKKEEMRQRHEASSPGNHKTPRALSPARGTHHHSSPLNARPHRHSHGTPKKRRTRESGSPSNRSSSSKYFAEKSKEQLKARAHPRSSLLHFMDRIEERKSSRETTLDEYLALEREQKQLLEGGTTKPKKKAEGSASRKTAGSWTQEREKFRNKHERETKGSSMGKWLMSARKEVAASSSSPGQHRKPSLKTQSLDKKQHSQYSRPRSFGLQRPQPQASFDKDARLDFSLAAKATCSPPVKKRPRDYDQHHEDRHRASCVRRKSSSDFAAHSPKIPHTHGKSNLMNTWISKQRR